MGYSKHRTTPRSSFMIDRFGMGAAPIAPDETPPFIPYAPPVIVSAPPALAPPSPDAPSVLGAIPPVVLWGGGALLAYWVLSRRRS